MDQNEIDTLMELGFTNLESQIYITLLQNPDSTGYKIAQILGKPIPNTYKALGKLKKKNVIISDESVKNQVYSPVHISEYLDSRELAFKNKRISIEQKLKKYDKKESNEGIYKIESIDQLFIKMEKIIKDAKTVILIDAFPIPLKKIKPVLEKKGKDENIRIVIKAYDKIEIANCEVNVSEHDKSYAESYFADSINLVTDGDTILFALLNRNQNEIYDSFWSNKTFLSLNIHNGFLMEFIFNDLANLIDQNKTNKDLLKMIKGYYPIFFNMLPAFKNFSTKFVPKEQIYNKDLKCWVSKQYE